MDSFSLKTASTYVNNLLLARGLLRNGKSIEFARPQKAEGGAEATMAAIINLVHDLVLRRDREQDQREALVQNVRTLRTEATRNTLNTERLQTRVDDLARQLSLAQSQERSARAALRTAESSGRALREEMIRLKTTVQQVRTACANDVRKRDVQIQRLKTHLTAQQRGNKTGLVGASITITPGSTATGSGSAASREEVSPDVDDPEYSLRQETTEFLTKLSQELSDENDNLIGLVRSTLATLRELQGLPESVQMAGEAAQDDDDEHAAASMLHALPTSYDALATDMDGVLETLRSLLTNPNFVPIDEVSIREEEIMRLRVGWEKMESKWKEAITMMDGWRKRMAEGGDTVNLEELKMGLGLGVGLETADTSIHSADTSLHSADFDLEDGVEPEEGEDELDAVDLPEVSSGELDEDDPVIPVQAAKRDGPDFLDIDLRPSVALKETNGNVKSPRKVNFQSPHQDKHDDLDENTSEMDINKHSPVRSTEARPARSRQTSKSTESRIPRKVRFNDSLAAHDLLDYSTSPLDTKIYIDPLQALKRLSSPHRHPDERSPKLTVQEKLNVAQAEAEAAAYASAKASKSKTASAREHEEAEAEAEEKVKELSPRKTKKIGGRPRRRKSTLTAAELDTLMNMAA
ncbi:hypothetical protein K402DRAFT_328468 [Aulographum hederae CBS 113979]|uniref:NIMA interactive protein n=1 Tax=Aulographum hederae CBS 113979 TaxID=1176131 RepID=A0A6G1H693_9PEZI|nr:hypothetical protein K402DRAFT_328468 [Aulographum hederae CBS 113979]